MATINKEESPIALLTWFAKIKRSGSAIEIINPIKIPKIITLIIFSDFAIKSPIYVPIFEIERLIPVRKIERPKIIPTHPIKNFIIILFSTGLNKFKIKTKTAMGTTALEFCFISSLNIIITSFCFIIFIFHILIFCITKEAI